MGTLFLSALLSSALTLAGSPGWDCNGLSVAKRPGGGYVACSAQAITYSRPSAEWLARFETLEKLERACALDRDCRKAALSFEIKRVECEPARIQSDDPRGYTVGSSCSVLIELTVSELGDYEVPGVVKLRERITSERGPLADTLEGELSREAARFSPPSI